MKKMTLQIFALILLGSFAYILYAHAPRIPDTAVRGEVQKESPIKVIAQKEETDAYRIDIEYPQLNIPAIDSRIQDTIDATLKEFKAYPANPPESATPKNELLGTYAIVRNDEDVASVQLTISEYTGGAHPNTAVLSINVNPKTGKEITLDDALSLIGMNLQQVSEQSLAQLHQQLGEDVIFPDGAAPKPENFGTFLVSTSSVDFVFQSYQVAPYSAGIPHTSFHLQ